MFIALFVEHPLCFLLCHNLRLHMLKNCSIGKTLLSVSCARFKSHICKLRPPPTLRPRNPCICPCLSRRRRSTHIQIVPIFFSSAGGVNACAGVLLEFTMVKHIPPDNVNRCLVTTRTSREIYYKFFILLTFAASRIFHSPYQHL